MVMQLKELFTPDCTHSSSTSREIPASVVIKHSMVAMQGLIMPAPLQQAPMRTGLPCTTNSMAIIFSFVSLVITAWATSCPLSRESPSANSGNFG